MGLSTLAICVGEEPETVEDVYEPFLLQLGLLQRTPRGRVATPAAWAHLGLEPPADRAPPTPPPCSARPDPVGIPTRPVVPAALGPLRHGTPSRLCSSRFGLMWVLLIRPQQRRMRQHQASSPPSQAGDEVVTAGGIYGTIASVDDDIVEPSRWRPGRRLRVLRSAVSHRITGRR